MLIVERRKISQNKKIERKTKLKVKESTWIILISENKSKV